MKTFYRILTAGLLPFLILLTGLLPAHGWSSPTITPTPALTLTPAPTSLLPSPAEPPQRPDQWPFPDEKAATLLPILPDWPNPESASTGGQEATPYHYFLFSIGAQAPATRFNVSTGVAVGPDGTVYVADHFNNRIQRFSADGVFLGTWGSAGSGDGQFAHPEGIAVAPDGTVYVADALNHRIQRFTASGRFLGKWGTYGFGNGQFVTPRGVAVAPDGTIYVTDTGNHRIQRFTATGQFLGKWGMYGSGDGQFNTPWGLAFDRYGHLYVVDTGNSRIQKFSATGTFLTKWGSEGSGNGQFRGPWGVAVDGADNVYITDEWNNRIQKFTASGVFLAKLGEGLLNLPSGIAVDQQNNLYVAEVWGHRVSKFSSQGSLILRWGGHGNAYGQFNEPNGVAIDSNGNIYVADTWNHRVQKFDATGKFILYWTRGFYMPTSLAIDSLGNVYVVDRGNHRIQKFTSDGIFLTEWGSQGSGNGQFNSPYGIAVDAEGFVYVTDTGNHRVQRFTSNGQFLGKWGSLGSGDGQFNEPKGIAISPGGIIYVVDTNNHRIQRFSTTGAFLGKWGSFGNSDGQFNQPSGITVARDYSVYVADTNNHRIQHFSATGQFLGKWGLLGADDYQFRSPMGVAAASNGMVYVADTWNYRIQVFGTAYPDTWRGEFFGNDWLAERPLAILNTSALNFEWSDGSPATGVPADHFSDRWRRYVYFQPGLYRFTILTDDGIRFWVDDRLVLESWQHQRETYTVDVYISEGYHRLLVEHWEDYGWAALALSWTRLLSLGEALDNTALNWTTIGNAPWFPQTSVYYYDGDAAQSGPISHNQASSLGTIISGTEDLLLSFYWKVSSEANYDFLQLYIDGHLQEQISGEVDWTFRNYVIAGPGTHIITWTYAKDGSVNSGMDSGWLDKVEIRPIRKVFLPATLRDYIHYFEGPWEQEPNNRASQANGPLRSGHDYYGYPNDEWDYFSIYLRTGGLITADLTNHTGTGVWLILFSREGQLLQADKDAPYHLEYNVPAGGLYYIAIYTAGNYNSTTPYTLRVTYPQ